MGGLDGVAEVGWRGATPVVSVSGIDCIKFPVWRRMSAAARASTRYLVLHATFPHPASACLLHTILPSPPQPSSSSTEGRRPGGEVYPWERHAAFV